MKKEDADDLVAVAKKYPKISIELNMCKGCVFLNYWNHENGNDVVCRIAGSKLYLQDYSEGVRKERSITLRTFVRRVLKSFGV